MWVEAWRKNRGALHSGHTVKQLISNLNKNNYNPRQALLALCGMRLGERNRGALHSGHTGNKNDT